MRTAQIRMPMPFVFDAAHEERVVKFDRTAREERWIVEVAAVNFVHGERFDLPAVAI